ncbi:MAG: galactitol-1-phosphate 5-dehydrogenase [Lachnospiraceae bacterium]|nr:galactitol-1-phosphate 5-dehydrogenase [Lachnospiraceae bacterium]
MKAQVLYAPGDLRYEEIAEPVIRENEVLLRVTHCGICGSDVPRVYQTGMYHMPCIPGHEFAGTVEACGAAVDAAWQGKCAAVFPLLPCMACDSCKKGIYETCAKYDYLGSRSDGAFSEYVRVPAANLIAIPDGVSPEEAAMSEPMAVAVHAMRMSGITDKNKRNNDTPLAVFGAGTIGMLLVMFLLEAGQENVFVIGNKDFQKERCIAFGLKETHFCDIRHAEDVPAWLRAHTNGRGAGVCFDCVGTNPVITQCVDAAAPGGTVILVGNPASDIGLAKANYWKILRRQLTLKGIWNSSFAVGTHRPEGGSAAVADDWSYVMERLAAHRIRPAELITHRMPLSELDRGLRIMRDKTEPYGKVMVTVTRYGSV